MNEPVEVWAEFGTFWAEPVKQQNAERWQADQTAAQSDRVWRVRWTARTATISPLDRLICDGREFEITGTTEVGRRACIEISGVAFSESGTTSP